MFKEHRFCFFGELKSTQPSRPIGRPPTASASAGKPRSDLAAAEVARQAAHQLEAVEGRPRFQAVAKDAQNGNVFI